MHQYFFWKTLISGIIIAINLQTGCMAKCTHPLFCQGPLFHSVQASRLFPDSKTFVDRPSLRPAEDILHDFENLLESSLSSLLQIQGGKEVNIVSQQEILFNFVKENFGPQGFDMRQYTPEDLVPFPEFSKNVSNRILSAWGGIVHRKWKDLSRVFVPPCPVCESSFIPVKHPFIIPGGRFLEAYYWDSYFAIKGLLVGGMERTTRGMIENFLDIVDKFGYFRKESVERERKYI